MNGATSPLPDELEATKELEESGFSWECDAPGWGYYNLNDAALKCVKRLRTIAFLDLFETCESDEVTDVGLENIAKCSSLRSLCLGPGLTDAALKHVANLVGLTVLRLDSAEGITDAGMDLLYPLTRLECLSIQYTQVGDTGLRVISHFTTLKELVLCHTKISDVGLRILASLRDLDYLALSDTAITDAGLNHLKAHSGMKSLWLDGTQVTDMGIAQLGHMAEMQSLLLSGKAITDAAIPHLLGFQNLKQLYLTDTDVSKEGLEILKKGLPECAVVT
jgi:hypothetical protein